MWVIHFESDFQQEIASDFTSETPAFGSQRGVKDEVNCGTVRTVASGFRMKLTPEQIAEYERTLVELEHALRSDPRPTAKVIALHEKKLNAELGIVSKDNKKAG